MDKPGMAVPADAVPILRARPRYVSRGGDKLQGALVALAVDPTGLDCIDAGVSTGGFTDCLLQHGARSVLAIDVGYGQIALPLRHDPRVELYERTNLRHFALPDARPRDLLVADLSFISLVKVLPRFRSWLRDGALALLLVKPQFEVARRDVGAGGVVRDAALRDAAAARVRAAAERSGFRFVDQRESVLPGASGNQERFLLVQVIESSADASS